MKKIPLLLIPLFGVCTINAQQPLVTPPTSTKEANFQCEIVLDIYDGFYDWVAVKSYSGSGKPLDSVKKLSPGAVTVANQNDTNGSGMGGNGGVDKDENSVLATDIGRNEIDLMKLVVKKRDDVPGLTGNVVLEKVKGTVKLWTQPYKGTEVNISSPLTIPVADLPKTYYIEATAVSTELRDIEFKISFNGKEDRVKATAVWVVKTNHWSDNSATPAVSDLSNLGGINKIAITTNEAENGTLYGHGDFRKSAIADGSWQDNSNNDKKFGGRILMEWQVFPPDAEQVASFDVTRQRKTRTWLIDYTKWEFTASPKNMNFPFEPDTEPADASEGDDVEEPNDDGNSLEDRDPKNGYLYSWDAPAILKKYPVEEFKAFHVSKNSFKEFVRARAKNSGFNIVDDTLQGSRASNKFDWHCVYYARRDEGYEMSIDTPNKSHCHLKSIQVDMNSSYMTVVNISGNISFEAGPFTIVYWGINQDGEKELEFFRFDGINVPVAQVYTIPASQTLWNLSLDGVTVTLQETATIPAYTFINFTVFKTGANAKDNIIGAGGYTNFTR
jgi:hypothetical protein